MWRHLEITLLDCVLQLPCKTAWLFSYQVCTCPPLVCLGQSSVYLKYTLRESCFKYIFDGILSWEFSLSWPNKLGGVLALILSIFVLAVIPVLVNWGKMEQLQFRILCSLYLRSPRVALKGLLHVPLPLM